MSRYSRHKAPYLPKPIPQSRTDLGLRRPTSFMIGVMLLSSLVGIQPPNAVVIHATASSITTSPVTTSISAPLLDAAKAQYSGLSSIPIPLRPKSEATFKVVPEPTNGSSTVPPTGHPDNKQRLTNSSGNTAKCAPLNPFGEMVQTSRAFLVFGAPNFSMRSA